MVAGFELIIFQINFILIESFIWIIISDNQGKTIRSVRKTLVKGYNKLSVRDLGSIPSGTYTLQVVTSEGIQSRRVVKLTN